MEAASNKHITVGWNVPSHRRPWPHDRQSRLTDKCTVISVWTKRLTPIYQRRTSLATAAHRQPLPSATRKLTVNAHYSLPLHTGPSRAEPRRAEPSHAPVTAADGRQRQWRSERPCPSGRRPLHLWRDGHGQKKVQCPQPPRNSRAVTLTCPGDT